MGDVIASWKREDQALSDAIYGDGRQSLIAHIIDPATPKSEMPAGLNRKARRAWLAKHRRDGA